MRLAIFAIALAIWPAALFAQSREEFHQAAQAAFEAGDMGLARELSAALLHSAGDARQERLAYARLDAIDAADPWHFSAFAHALPSTNINAAANASTMRIGRRSYQILGGGQPKTGIGYRFGGEARYLGVIGPGLRLGSALRVTRIQYPDLPRLDRWIVAPELSLRKELPRLTLTASAHLRRAEYDSARASGTEQGLRLEARRFLSGASSVSLASGYEWIDKDHQDYLDGSLAHLAFGLRHAPNARTDLAAELRFDKRDARGRHNGFAGARLWAEARYQLGPQDTLDLSLTLAQRLHDIPTPGIGQTRRDTDFAIGAGWTNGRIRLFGAAPRIGCSHSQTRSNLALYSTRATNCALSLTAGF